jgi:hypothetical protein
MLTEIERERVDQLRARVGLRKAARLIGVGHDSVYRALRGEPLRVGTAMMIRLALSMDQGVAV